MVDCNGCYCHVSQSCHPHINQGIKYPVKNILKLKIKHWKYRWVIPAFTFADDEVTYQSRKIPDWKAWINRDTGQHSGNGVWDLERKSCSLIIKKSVWWVQMELSHRRMHTHVCGVRGILCSGLKLSRKKKQQPCVRRFVQIQRWMTSCKNCPRGVINKCRDIPANPKVWCERLDCGRSLELSKMTPRWTTIRMLHRSCGDRPFTLLLSLS